MGKRAVLNKMIENAKVVDVFGQEHPFSKNGKSGIIVSWFHEGKEVKKEVVTKQKQALVPCIAKQKDSIVLVYGELEGIVSPYNASIFNADGTLRMHLIIPNLISEEYKEYEKKVEAENAKSSIKFLWPYIFKKRRK